MASGLVGVTRRSRKFAPIENPIPHRPLAFQNKVIIEVHGPDGKLKRRIEKQGNYMTDFGLSRIASLIGSSSIASTAFAAGVAIGTSTTAATNSQTSLLGTFATSGSASAVTPSSSGVSANWAASFASQNVASVVNEIGLFQVSTAYNGSMVGRIVLGASSINLGSSDTILATYTVVCKTA